MRKCSTDPYATVKPQEAHLYCTYSDATNLRMNMMLREYKRAHLSRHAKLMDLDSDSFAHILDLANQRSTCERDSRIIYGIAWQHILSLKIARKEAVVSDDIRGQWKPCCTFHSEGFYSGMRDKITTNRLDKRCMEAVEATHHYSLDVRRIITSSVLETFREPPMHHNIAIARRRRLIGSYAQANRARASREQASSEGNATLFQEGATEREALNRRRVRIGGAWITGKRRDGTAQTSNAGCSISDEQRTQPSKGGKRKKEALQTLPNSGPQCACMSSAKAIRRVE